MKGRRVMKAKPVFLLSVILILSACSLNKPVANVTLSNTATTIPPTPSFTPTQTSTPTITLTPTQTPTPTITPTATPRPVTNIVIDGQCDEWSEEFYYEMDKVGIVGEKLLNVYAMENNDSIFVCVNELDAFLEVTAIFVKDVFQKTLVSGSLNSELHFGPGFYYSEDVAKTEMAPIDSEFISTDNSFEFRIRLDEFEADHIKLGHMEITLEERSLGVYKRLYLYADQDAVIFVDEIDPVTTSDDSVPPPITKIIVDGIDDDWSEIELLEEYTNVGEAGFLDITGGAVFSNQQAIYFYALPVDPSAPFVQFGVEIYGANGQRRLFTWRTESQYGHIGDTTSGHVSMGRAQYSFFDFEDVFEGRIDLRDLEGISNITRFSIRVSVGICCEYPEWRAADEWFTRRVPRVYEIDNPRLYGSEPTYEQSRYFELKEPYLIELFFSPPMQSPGQIAVSENGVMYVLHRNYDCGLSVVDYETGEVTKLWSRQYCGLHVVGGPGDTAIIRANNEIWMVSPDGSHEVWGIWGGYYPFAYTADGRMIGVGNSGNPRTIAEIFPDGSAEIIVENIGFVNDLEVTSDGSIFVAERRSGSIIKISPDGTRVSLGNQGVYNDTLYTALDSQENLYRVIVGEPRLVRLDKDTGAKSVLLPDIHECTSHPSDLAFVDEEEVYIIDGAMGVMIKGNIKTNELDLAIPGYGTNSRAIDLGPDGALYLGEQGCINSVPGRIYRIDDNGQIEIFLDNLPIHLIGLRFSADGELFFIAGDTIGTTALYHLSPEKDTPVMVPGSLKMNLMTLAKLENGNVIVWANSNIFASKGRILEYSSEGLINEYTYSPGQAVFDMYISMGPDGHLYSCAYLSQNATEGPTIYTRIFQINLETGETEIILKKDFHETNNVYCFVTVTPDNDIWALYAADWDRELHKVYLDGTTELIAKNLPVDPDMILHAPNGDVYFGSASGVLRVYEE